MIRILSVIAAASFTFSALAQDKPAGSGCCKKDGATASCQKDGQAKSAAGCCKSGNTAKAGCVSAPAFASRPKMSYVVGDKTACCPKDAESMALTAKTKVQYKVAEKTYADEAEAQKALADALDEYLASITSIQYAVGEQTIHCPVGAAEMAKKENKPLQYRLASFTFVDKDRAEKAATQAKAAADKVEMKIVVGDKSYSCPMSANSAAKTCGAKVEYAVGEAKTCCPTEAKTRLAQARVDAALKVLAESAEATGAWGPPSDEAEMAVASRDGC